MPFGIEIHSVPPRRKDAKPLTAREEVDSVALIYGKNIANRMDLSLSSRRKLYEYESRVRIVPVEVLDASDASISEKNFLLGHNNHDPEPTRIITYYDLIEGEEIDVPYMDITKPVLPRSRSFRPEIGGIKGLLYGLTQAGYLEEQAGIHRRQIDFKVQVRGAINILTASSALIEEVPFLRSVERGLKIPDPHPDHHIKYKSLVKAPEISIFEN